MIKLLAIGDSPTTPTGFSRVMTSIFKYLPKEDYDIVWLATGYNGDPHNFPYKLYPPNPRNKTDLYGLERLEEIYRRENPDLTFIVNDAWIINHLLEKIKSFSEDNFPKIITYSPVDARDHDPEWYQHFNLCEKVVLYNTFGQNVVRMAAPELETSIIYHGVDSDVFYKLDETRLEVRKRIYKDDDKINNAFIVFSGARNQPRKRLDITMTAFSIFAQNKPEAMLYLHCFTPGHTVYTRAGIKNIEDILPGDEVLTHKGRYRKVLNTQVREYSGKILDIAFRGGDTISATPEHPFYAVTRKPCRDASKSFCNMDCGVEYKQNFGNFPYLNCKKSFYNDYFLEWKAASTLTKAEQLYFAPPTENSFEALSDDYQLARLCGYFVSEGSLSKYGVAFTTNSLETPLHEEITESMQDLFAVSEEKCKTYLSTAKTAFHQHFYSRDAVAFFEENCGKGARNKKVPQFVLEGSEDIKIEFLTTAFLGDGTYSKRYGFFRYVTFSKTLAYQMKLLFCQLGIGATLHLHTVGGKFAGYHVDVNGMFAQQFAKLLSIDFTIETKNQYQKIKKFEDGFLYEITSVTEREYSGPVYNMEVEEDNSYTVNGAVVHNCGPRDMSMDIPKLANRLGIADKIIMTTNQNGPQRIPESRLNDLYNLSDVGINTSLGEGLAIRLCPCYQ